MKISSVFLPCVGYYLW